MLYHKLFLFYSSSWEVCVVRDCFLNVSCGRRPQTIPLPSCKWSKNFSFIFITRNNCHTFIIFIFDVALVVRRLENALVRMMYIEYGIKIKAITIRCAHFHFQPMLYQQAIRVAYMIMSSRQTACRTGNWVVVSYFGFKNKFPT